MPNIKHYFQTKFPQDIETVSLLTNYFERIDFNPTMCHLGEHQLLQLFSAYLNDYQSFKLDPDQFAVLCGKTYLLIQKDIKLNNTEIANLLLIVSDLDWQLRENPNAACETLKTLREYYSRLHA